LVERPAARLDRTTSDVSSASDAVIASGRLKARNSVSASGRSMRNGRTMSRVSVRGFASSAAALTGIRNL
jgi:hypothetical protein